MSEVDDFWAEVVRLLPPQDDTEIFYRLYHDADGHPLFYSMEDLPGNYIEIDQATYSQASGHVRVVDGRLQKLHNTKSVGKIRPSTKGTSCDPRDVCVIVTTDQPHVLWKKTYES